MADEVRELEEFLAREGYRKCDIAACNCGSYHEGHANRRLREIIEELGGCHGTNALAEVTRLREQLEQLNKDQKLWLRFCPPKLRIAGKEYHSYTSLEEQLKAASAACMVTEGHYWHWTDEANKKIETALAVWRKVQENDDG